MTTISSTSSVASVRTPLPNPAGRQAMKDLTAALKAEDLGAARQAFAQVVKNAPEGATWNPDSGFAAVGRALKDGDVVAAREAGKAALQGLRETKAPVSPGVAEPQKTPTTTGGSVGAHLNVVA
jgi:hypothetical protein